MKNIFIYSWIIITSLFSGCSFLEEGPEDRLVTKNFYTNAKDAQAAVDGIYQQLYSIYNRQMFLMCDLPADCVKNGLGMPNAFLQDLEFLRYTPENTFIRDTWQNNYSGIMRANAAINNIPAIAMDEALRNRYVGEAKFLRALFYFNLVRFYGDVPLVLKLDNINDAMGPRIDKETVYAQIIDDLTSAGASLPLSKDVGSKEIGRATKGAAQILLGKVYLTKGDFMNAKNVLAEIVEHEDTYGYGLHENYGANWNPSTEAGKEAVFYIEYKPAPLTFNGEMGLTGPKYSISEPVGVAGSNEADIPTMELFNAFEENDTRWEINFRTQYTNPQNGHKITSSIPLFGKYWQEGLQAENQCEINIHIIRYADALLMYAEALNEAGESDKAHVVLNRVRQRACHDTSGDYNGLSKEVFRATVLKERWLEFPLEGHRWFDLVRTGTFVQRMKEHSAYEAKVAEKNKTDIAANVKDYMILMPIPQRELDLNAELTQNPGWN